MNEAARHPRVLVVGQPFDRTTGGGITLSNLFEGWPKDRLAAAVVPGYPVGFDVCDRYYVLGTSEITWGWPLSVVSRTETPASQPDFREPATTTSVSSSEPPEPGVARRGFRAGLDGLGVADALRRMRLSPRLSEWIRAFEPDVVYSQLSDLPVMTLVSEILDETGLPFALHVMDDWPSTMYQHGVLARQVRGEAERSLGSLLHRAKARMAIGDAMAEEFLQRYGVEFVPIQNSVDVARQDQLASLHRAEYEEPPGSPVSVVYAGRVGRANADSLLAVAEVVAEMATGGVPIRLYVYTASGDHPTAVRMSLLEGVEVRSAVSYDHIPALLESADVLLMPLDFDEEGMRFARLSMPTKIPEYMVAGRPVLTYAPRGSAIAEYARTGGWSMLVDEPDPALVRAALTALAGSRAMRDAMGRAGRSIAIERHDAARVRAHFTEELVSAALGTARTVGGNGS
jgi:glycosyltransferase involved in cell wall biosynthesis